MTQRDLALAIKTGERFVVELEAGKGTSQLGKALAAAQAIDLQISGPPERASGHAARTTQLADPTTGGP